MEPRQIEDDESLTQYGRVAADGPTFRNALRQDRDEASMSLALGDRSVAEMVRFVKRSSAVADDKDRVRTTTAGRLRRAGFIVEHTPTRKNPDHVSVTTDGDWDSETGPNDV